MSDVRAAKIWKLYYHPDVKAGLSVFEDEIRISGSDKTFISVTEDGLSFQGGLPSKLSFGTISPIWGGMSRDMPFPMTLIAGPTSPPKQLPNIPLESLLSLLESLGDLLSIIPR